MNRNRQAACMVGICFFLLLTLAGHLPAFGAEQYPGRGIEIVLAMGPGSGVDIFFRSIREALSGDLKVPVTIVNRPGGNMAVACSSVANAKPDGYTLLGLELPSLLITQAVMKMPYDAFKDFDPVSHLVLAPNLLVVRSDAKFGSIEELVSYAKKNPGKLLAGVSGQTTTNRFDLELLKASTGVDINHIPLVAGGELLTSLLGGHTDFTMTNVSSLKPHIKAGKLKPLATLTNERLQEFPQVPTTKEAGIPEVNINSSYVLLGPKGLPAEITARLARSIHDIFQTAQVKANTAQLGFLPAVAGPVQLRERMEKDFARYQDIAKKADIKQLQ